MLFLFILLSSYERLICGGLLYCLQDWVRCHHTIIFNKIASEVPTNHKIHDSSISKICENFSMNKNGSVLVLHRCTKYDLKYCWNTEILKCLKIRNILLFSYKKLRNQAESNCLHADYQTRYYTTG